MSAKDYEIACGCFSAYIARKKKKPSKLMSDDRVELEEETILQLIDWYIDNYLTEQGKDTGGLVFKSAMRNGCRVKLIMEKVDEAPPHKDEESKEQQN